MADSRESRMVVLCRDNEGKPTVWCDPEIADIVYALNAGGLPTVASCSGHGYRPGSIALKDSRWLVIASDHAALQRIEALFPLDINGEPVAIADHIALMAELRVEQIMREQREQK